MAERTLIARVRPDVKDPETLIVSSPIVGMADGAPRMGVFLNPLDRIISMKRLNERFVLRLPRDVQGRVTEVFVPNRYAPVAFDQPLARLDPRVLQEADAKTATAGRASHAGAAGEEVIAVQSPSEGIFYRRPSPDAPAYVEVGTRVTTGTVLGLVEVMKCFNQITYGGPALPESGEVVKILADDSAEVQFGQPLFWVRPLK